MNSKIDSSEDFLELANSARNKIWMLYWMIPFDIAIIYIMPHMQTAVSVRTMTLILVIVMGLAITLQFRTALNNAKKYELLAQQTKNK